VSVVSSLKTRIVSAYLFTWQSEVPNSGSIDLNVDSHDLMVML